MSHRLLRAALAAVLVALAAATVAVGAASAKQTAGTKPNVKPLFKELKGKHSKGAFPSFQFS